MLRSIFSLLFFSFTIMSSASVVDVKNNDENKVSYSVSSPNGKLNIHFYQKSTGNGATQMYYQVSFNKQAVVLESELGILIKNNLFESALGIENDPSVKWCENLELISVDRDTVNNSWKPVYGERNLVKNNYNQLVLHFNKYGENPEIKEGQNGTNYDKRRSYNMDFIIRVYNEGVAFRYYFPETSNGLFLHIEGEQTSYTLPEKTMAYYESWAQGSYSYLPLKNWPDESERPLTLDLENGLHVALLEAEMIDYSRGKFKLSEEKPNTINLSMYDKVDVITPYATPWRVIMVAEKPEELLENNDIVLNLNQPNQIKDTSWIKPGKAIRSNLNMKEARECVDFALQRNLQYVHLDAGWYGPEMKMSSDATKVSPKKDIQIQELVNYAAEKNIGIFLYINQRALTDKLDEVFAQCREWGIKGVKFGFVQIGSSRWSNWLHKAIEKAAEYHLLVDVHDEFRPTGFSRTYPNLMTQEGVRGNEEMPDATHNTILPFTRYIAGAGDYTISYYNKRNKNTHAHQLALSVIYYSPIQFLYWYDLPSAYKGEPEIAFFDAVPTVWDDTKVLKGTPGEYIVTARKSGEDWFLGAITNTEAREVKIDLDFLDADTKYQAIIYSDDDQVKTSTKVGVKKIKVISNTSLTLKMKASGGTAIQFKKIK